MRLTAIGGASEGVRDELMLSYASLIGSSAGVRNHIDEQISEWERTTSTALSAEFPFAAHERSLREYRSRLRSRSVPQQALQEAVRCFTAFCKAIGHPANEAFWMRQLGPSVPRTAIAEGFADDVSISVRLFLTDWQKRMDQARAEWEFEQIGLRRASLLEHLDRILRLLKNLQEQLEVLGFDTGLLIDLSKGRFSAQDIGQVERWARYFAEDPGIRALCELLGKIRQIGLSERIERVRSVVPVKSDLPDINSREEIVGIRPGKDIGNLLPSEIALLADPDTALLFDLKYVESGLMCFDLQGMQSAHLHLETEAECNVEAVEKQGPMVICIDTSGSMRGVPEVVAKAVALFLAVKAREQQRQCYLISFSTSIETLDLSGQIGMQALLGFLRMSFHGGTDAAPALEHALDVMERDAYRNADLLVVSDFVMSDLPQATSARIADRRRDGNRFHSLVVGGCYMNERLRTLFDNEWIHDPANGAIRELIRFETLMRRPAGAAPLSSG